MGPRNPPTSSKVRNTNNPQFFFLSASQSASISLVTTFAGIMKAADMREAMTMPGMRTKTAGTQITWQVARIDVQPVTHHVIVAPLEE